MVADRKTAAQALALNKPCKQEGWPPDIQLLGAVRVSYSGPLSSEGAVNHAEQLADHASGPVNKVRAGTSCSSWCCDNTHAGCLMRSRSSPVRSRRSAGGRHGATAWRLLAGRAGTPPGGLRCAAAWQPCAAGPPGSPPGCTALWAGHSPAGALLCITSHSKDGLKGMIGDGCQKVCLLI